MTQRETGTSYIKGQLDKPAQCTVQTNVGPKVIEYYPAFAFYHQSIGPEA